MTVQTHGMVSVSFSLVEASVFSVILSTGYFGIQLDSCWNEKLHSENPEWYKKACG